MFMYAFSTCWNSHRHIDGRAMVTEIRELGFENVELGHATPISLLHGILEAVAAGETRICSVHNFCPLPLTVTGPAPDCYLPSSRRERERELAVRHTLQTLEWAARLSARVVVLHLGVVPIRQYTRKLLRWQKEQRAQQPRYERVRRRALARRERKAAPFLAQVYRTLEAVVPRARELGLRLGLETRLAIEEIPSADETEVMLQQFGGDVVAYWHDVGHAQIREGLGLDPQETVLARFRGRTVGMHLQDFAPPAYDHLPPGRGQFDFDRLRPFVDPEMLLVWEIHQPWTADEIRAGVTAVRHQWEAAAAQ
ncbi:sugar phosphate isomerase/epimerase [bacterium]|nr:sugar phosphate isomerase/epimerase [bacterium]